jgi:hypothetical protein
VILERNGDQRFGLDGKKSDTATFEWQIDDCKIEPSSMQGQQQF